MDSGLCAGINESVCIQIYKSDFKATANKERNAVNTSMERNSPPNPISFFSFFFGWVGGGVIYIEDITAIIKMKVLAASGNRATPGNTICAAMM